MTRFVNDIKRAFIQPGVVRDEVEWLPPKGHKGAKFWIEEIIWLDVKMPTYRIAIPEDVKWRDDEAKQYAEGALEMRFVEYEPTGRVVYDTSRGQKNAVVWEYRLKHSRDLTL